MAGCMWVAGIADLLPVVSGVLVDKSLIINDVSFSSIGLSFSTMEA